MVGGDSWLQLVRHPGWSLSALRWWKTGGACTLAPFLIPYPYEANQRLNFITDCLKYNCIT